MLFPVAGSRLFIRHGGSLVEIGSPESLGAIGGRWDLHEAGYDHDDWSRRYIKGNMSPGAMQLVFGHDPDDLGQLALWQSYRSDSASEFRLELANGTSWRQWEALVVSISEGFEEANIVTKMLAELQINSAILRSED